MKTKPFDLERALAGDPVVTVGGDPVTELRQLPGVDSEFNLCGVSGGAIRIWRNDGRWDSGGHPLDLRMLVRTEKRTVYGVAWVDLNGNVGAHVFGSNEFARDDWLSKHREDSSQDTPFEVVLEFEV